MDKVHTSSFKRFLFRVMPAGLCAADRMEPASACKLDNKSYPHGSQIMEGAKILECVNGEWEERINCFVTVGP